ncbi:PAS domain S-box protein [Thauera propionica]|uniref:PAS domain S-box protein n=1 Tax=Thauera propionica TaxID=2019431 RepID=A0A235F1P2_9RHOO|nr:EAL domain-containing protein [Thauera propionica]OYD54777.1 PAS domain S-box protein [Thauera propionica]
MPRRHGPILERYGVWLVAALFACITGLGVWSPLHRLDLLAYDAIEPVFRGPALTPASVIVAIDDDTLDALGQWPWSRAVHAEMIDRLDAAGVAAIGVSILFSEPGPDDTRLAASIAASGRVVLPVAPRAGSGGEGVIELLATAKLGEGAAAYGHVDVELDADGLSRRTFAQAGSGSPHWDALALATLKQASRASDGGAAQRVGADTWIRPVTSRTSWMRRGEILLPYPDGRGAPAYLSYFDVPSRPELLRQLQGKTVFIGATASGIDAALATPAGAQGGRMAAVEFHARAFEALRSGLVYRSADPVWTVVLSLAFLVLPATLFGRVPATLAFAGLLVAPPLGSGLALNTLQLWIPPMTALVGLILGSILWFALHLVRTRGSLNLALNDADATLRSIADAVITLDASARITLTNPVAEQLSGLSRSGARGQSIDALVRNHTEQAGWAIEAVLACLKTRRTIRVPDPIRWTTPDGEAHMLRLTATPVGGTGDGAVLALTDVTDTLAMTARLQHEATHDPLTGLPNRALLLDRLHQALANAERRGSLLALLFVDLDRFKRINDSLGHSAGDHVLRVAAERLQSSVRAGDTVARWGGDEFIILLDNITDTHAVVAVADKLLGLLERDLRTESGTDLVLSCSVGISIGPKDSKDAATLLSMADKAMYRGKIEGGHRYAFYSPEMNTWSRERLSLEAALHHALANREFELFYQPQIDIATSRLVGLESLIRWRRPDGGLVRPDAFIPAAEESGLICSIGDWAIGEALQQGARWRAEGLPPVPLSVNVSARQCSDMRIVDTIRHGLADTGLEPGLLKVEVTESTAMHSAERAAELLHSIDALGVGLSVDDFGTGYSSLSLLKRFPISELKIDRSFVGDVGREGDDAAIVRGTIALAHGLGMSVVAEGVETQAQLRFLAGQGCDAAQGYLFSQPLPAAEVREWLKAPPPHVPRSIHLISGTLH